MSGVGARGPVAARQLGMIVLSAKCVGAGAATPTGLEGDASSVARSGTGDYVFTFPSFSGGLDIRGVHASVRQADTVDLVPFYTYDEAAGTVTVTTKDAGAAFAEADISSSEELHVIVWAKTLKV